MSSDLRSDSWAVSVEQTLTRPTEGPLAGTIPPPIPLTIPRVEPEPALPSVSQTASSGLRARLLIVDAAAAAAAWLVLGVLLLPASTVDRQWGALLAATAVTLVAMQFARLVPIAPLCAAWPGDGSDRRRCRGGRRDPRVAPWRWEPQLSRRDRCRRVLRSCSGGFPLDVLSVVACTAGAGSLSPRTRHGRDQRRCRCRLEHAALAARARIRSAGDHRGDPESFGLGITYPAALLSTSFQRWPGKPTPTGFCWWPMHSRQRSFTGSSRSGRQTDCTSKSGRVSGDWERVAFAVFQ